MENVKSDLEKGIEDLVEKINKYHEIMNGEGFTKSSSILVKNLNRTLDYTLEELKNFDGKDMYYVYSDYFLYNSMLKSTVQGSSTHSADTMKNHYCFNIYGMKDVSNVYYPSFDLKATISRISMIILKLEDLKEEKFANIIKEYLDIEKWGLNRVIERLIFNDINMKKVEETLQNFDIEKYKSLAFAELVKEDGLFFKAVKSIESKFEKWFTDIKQEDQKKIVLNFLSEVSSVSEEFVKINKFSMQEYRQKYTNTISEINSKISTSFNLYKGYCYNNIDSFEEIGLGIKNPFCRNLFLGAVSGDDKYVDYFKKHVDSYEDIEQKYNRLTDKAKEIIYNNLSVQRFIANKQLDKMCINYKNHQSKIKKELVSSFGILNEIFEYVLPFKNEEEENDEYLSEELLRKFQSKLKEYLETNQLRSEKIEELRSKVRAEKDKQDKIEKQNKELGIELEKINEQFEEEQKKFVNVFNDLEIAKDYLKARLTAKDELVLLNTYLDKTKVVYEEKIKNLKSEKEKAVENFLNTSKEKANVITEFKRVQQEVEDNKVMINTYKGEISLLQKDKDILLNKSETFIKEKEKLTLENGQLIKLNSSLKDEITKLKIQLEEALALKLENQTIKNYYDEEISKIRKQNEQLEVEVEKAKREKDDIESQNKALNGKLNILKKDIEEKIKDNEDLRNQVISLTNDKAKLVKDMGTKMLTIGNQITQIALMEQKINEYEIKMKENSKQIEEFKVQMEKEKERLEKVITDDKAKNNEIIKEYITKNNVLDNMYRTITHSQSELEIKFKTMKLENDDLQERIKISKKNELNLEMILKNMKENEKIGKTEGEKVNNEMRSEILILQSRLEGMIRDYTNLEIENKKKKEQVFVGKSRKRNKLLSIFFN